MKLYYILLLIIAVWAKLSVKTFAQTSTSASDTTSSTEPELTPIHEIQGKGDKSSFVRKIVKIRGIVTGDFQTGEQLKGFFLQEETPDKDTLTSEGIFVFDDVAPKVDVKKGDKIELIGKVAEYRGLTEIGDVVSVKVLSSNNALPKPIEIDLPFPSEDYLEQFEGMLVTFPQKLFVTDLYRLGRAGEFQLSAGSILAQPTNVVPPGIAAKELQELNDRNRIVIDDNTFNQNVVPIPYPGNGLSADNTLRGGCTTTGLTGILNYSWSGFKGSPSAYRVHPTEPIKFESDNARTAKPETVGGDIKVASFNVLNYFNGDGNGDGYPTPRGADTEEEFQRQRAKIINAIAAIDADVVGLMEIENDGYGEKSAIQDLVNGLNAKMGEGAYTFVNAGVESIGTDAITVGMIYKPAIVEEVGEVAVLDQPAETFQGLGTGRPPMAQTFKVIAKGNSSKRGEFTVVVNHFKSKGRSGLDDKNDPNYDKGDGQAFWNQRRVDAANAITEWLLTYPTGNNDEDILLIGDLNAYALEDPVKVLETNGYTNLLKNFLGVNAYSYSYAGQWGYLDHGLSSVTLTPQVTGATEWHINSAEPAILDYNMEYKSDSQIKSLYNEDPYRASDHDPVIIGLKLKKGFLFW
ncbi:ExeM/NucH family extracellular endonuclease [Chondrinema litorale]|uniref:ExeM/NucH family extracellular endonuclease n=1 Tax=Chondrinema litorale TaxID=2994555 RepID=UPI002543C9D7|nr:ExeM/NucH family extracellular endonuclease [Chondrinema litorale]UZR98298.1 ExeM/NucH family extracellular endonuclease [Chondrinema litorale]